MPDKMTAQEMTRMRYGALALAGLVVAEARKRSNDPLVRQAMYAELARLLRHSPDIIDDQTP